MRMGGGGGKVESSFFFLGKETEWGKHLSLTYFYVFLIGCRFASCQDKQKCSSMIDKYRFSGDPGS